MSNPTRPVDARVSQRYPLLEERLWAESRVNGGMVTTVDSADLEESALVLARNVRVRYDKTSRRFGLTAITPADTDSAPALELAVWKQNNGNIFLVKMRPAGPRYSDFSAWFGPTGTALTGTTADRFEFAVAQNRFIFTNNGMDYVQQLVTGSPGTFSRLGNAPKARHVTGFYNRIVVANYTDPLVGTPVTVGWSGDLNPTEFDPLVDLSAGSSPIVDSPSDVVDYITRIIGFTNVMVVLRERSTWVATKQPIASNPFYFSNAMAGIGCNCPNSVAVIPGGLAWVDLITGTVWAWQIGEAPERIGLKIENTLISGITDQNQVFGSYSGRFNEYTVGIVQAGTNVRKLWTYNFISKAWSFDELENVTDIFDGQESFSVGLAIGGLVGTIGQLQGTIAGLVSTRATSITRLVGKSDGTIYRADESADSDTFGSYEAEIQSKDFVFPDVDTYVSQVRIEYEAYKSGQLELSYTKDGGANWTVAKTIMTSPGSPRLLRVKKSIKARRFRWRIKSSSGLWDILSYEIRVFAGGESRK